MNTSFQKTRILILVMTYPHPSSKYQELVCTGGITETGEWVRLYPIDYRYRPPNQQFRKYQWIEVELESHGAGHDNRRESRKPNLDSIKLLGEPISPKDDWKYRKKIIDSLPHYTVIQLKELWKTEKVSLGIVKPIKIHDLKVEPADSEWKPEWQELYSQLRLFGNPPKPLRKLPYKFSYIFECADSQKPHAAMIEDWELGVLFLKESARLGTDEKAVESVRKAFFDKICGPDKDTRFFMGTVFPYNTWVVIGTFWPPKKKQPELF